MSLTKISREDLDKLYPRRKKEMKDKPDDTWGKRIDFEKLRAFFKESDLEWRIQQSGTTKTGSPWGLVLCYVDARAVQRRLDEVCDPDHWICSYEHLHDGVLCTLSIKSENLWIAKQDGSPETAIEAFKGGISKALVRTASVWGVGRYLYELPTHFATFQGVDKKTKGAKYDKPTKAYWVPPAMPKEFLP